MRLRGSIPTSDARVVLARDIHDGIAQDLVAVGYRLDCLLARPDVDGEVRTEIRDLRLMISETLSDVRRDLFALRTKSEQSLRHQLLSIYNEIAVGFEGGCDLEDLSLSTEDESLLVEVARELLRNAARHSQGRSIWLTLMTTADSLLLTVSDDGIGGAKVRPGHFGLVGINEKVTDRAGSLIISGKHGSAITISLPLFTS